MRRLVDNTPIREDGSGPRGVRSLVQQDAEPSSSSTGTFNGTALSYFEPGLSPTTTKSVFFDTEPLTLPPATSTASVADVAEKSRGCR
jgi:hypothetical protein